MAARPTWKGVLKISLVTIPIKVFPATDSAAGLSFNQLHAECQTRITQKRWCPTCDREIPMSEVEKGFEFEKGRYVILHAEEFDAVQPPSAKTIDLVQFVDAAQLDPVVIDRTYYLTPDGDRGAEAFAVMRQAMAGTVGIGKLAIYGREYLVAIRAPQALAPAIVLHTLHHAAEIRSVESLGEDVAAVPTRAPVDQVQLARKVISTLMQSELALDAFTDAYQADLRKLIDAKIDGREIIEPPPSEPAPVVALTEALTKSLRLVSGAKTAAAKVSAEREERKRKRA